MIRLALWMECIFMAESHILTAAYLAFQRAFSLVVDQGNSFACNTGKPKAASGTMQPAVSGHTQ